MRRKDLEVTDPEFLRQIVETSTVCTLSLCVDNQPYLVPLNYGYQFEGAALTLYFHSAAQGRKLDVLRANPEVAFEMHCDVEPVFRREAQNYTCNYKSIIGFGKAEFIEDNAEKRDALTRIVQHYNPAETAVGVPQKVLDLTCVFRVEVREFTGKAKQVSP